MGIEQSRQFLVMPEKLMELSMELASLTYANAEMCKWLGPYELEHGENDYVAEYYRQYFEERLSFLLLTLAIHLRALDDRGLIDKYVKHEDPIQIELGRICRQSKWEEINNFRTVLNFIIHADELVPRWRINEQHVHGDGGVLIREVRSFGPMILLSGRLERKPASLEINLRAFCDMVFRVVESLRGPCPG